MRTFALSFVLFLAVTLTASATSVTTPLYDNWGGTSDCSYGAVSSCSSTSWWNNETLQVDTWSDSGSYGESSWVSSGKSTQYSYNQGTNVGESWWMEDSGAGWSVSDYSGLTESSWSGSSADTNGWTTLWGGSDTQNNHTMALYFWDWSCAGALCSQDSSWESINDYQYAGEGWWVSYLFGERYSSDEWENSFRLFNPQSGSNHFEWNRSGAEIPEPGTYALVGLGLLGLACIRRRHTIRAQLPSRSGRHG